jgi:acyl-CoA hydrolase/RimJ/RimL family protein N-acetyltransferase
MSNRIIQSLDKSNSEKASSEYPLQASSDDWQTRHADKIKTAEQAVLAVEAGQHVFIGTACATPRTLVAALENTPRPPPDIELVHFITTNAFPHDEAGRALTRYRHRTFFVSTDIRAAVQQGLAEYVPIQLSRVPDLMARGSLPIDVAMIQVSPPDEFGYVSLGISVDIIPAAVSAARRVIAEVNPAMPRTQGDSTLHLDDIDILVPVDTPVTEYIHVPVTEQVVQQIARYIAGIIDDGATLQVGLGRIPNEALRYLADRRDLGIHSDVITDSILPLLRNGTLTGRQKSVAKGKIVASYALGSRALYDTLNGNALFAFHPITWVADEDVIAAQNKMVSISQAFSIDLTGQVCADQFEGQLYGGLGAQVEFVRGAARSEGGKPIVCLTSRTDDGTKSRIRPVLAPGEAATLARSAVHYVVTEFGIAYLHGKSLRERALALIAIAHPDFRDALLAEAKALGYLEASCTIKNVFPYPVEDERTVKLKSGKSVTLRPAMVYDAGSIKSLFYELPATDRYTRFFRQIKSLSSDDVEKLCNVDYRAAVAFVAVDGARETNHVVGHASYFINPSTNMGETAFMVAPSWQGTGLGSALQKCLVEHAKSRGIRGFQAEILPQNASMIRLARSCCENVSTQRDEDAVHVTMIF